MSNDRDALIDLYLAIPIEVFESLPRQVRYSTICTVYRQLSPESRFVEGYDQAFKLSLKPEGDIL